MVTKIQRDSIKSDVEADQLDNAIIKLEAAIALEMDKDSENELRHALEHLDAAKLDPDSLQKDRTLRALNNIEAML